jgi:hypothetical protein
VLQSQATTTDVDGFLVERAQQTTIQRMQLITLSLSRGAGSGRGRFAYRSRFSLNATESLDPGNEAFALTVSNAGGPLVDFALPAAVSSRAASACSPTRAKPRGIRALVLREVGPGLWSIRVRGPGSRCRPSAVSRSPSTSPSAATRSHSRRGSW